MKISRIFSGYCLMIVVMEIVVCIILLVVGIAVLVAIHVCIVGRAFRRDDDDDNEAGDNSMDVQRDHNNRRRRRRSPSMSQDEIMGLPCFDYGGEEDTEKSTSPLECAVCLENFNVGEICRLLPNCNHIFHAHCIDSWLSMTAVCPICRKDASKMGAADSCGNELEIV